MMLVSVIMAVHNSAKYLRESVESLRAQTHQAWELLATDDASSDESVAILQSFNDPRIQVFPLAVNVGPAEARNHSLGRARGEVIAILDSDDTSLPDRFSRQLAILNAHKELRGTGSSVECSLPLQASPEFLKAALLFRNLLFHSSLMYRAPVELYNRQFRYAHDYELAVRLGSNGLMLSREVFSKYRSHQDNVTHRFSDKQRGFAQRVQQGQLAFLGLAPNPEQERLHFDLGLEKSFNNLHDLEQAGGWLKGILSANLKTQSYPHDALKKTCEHLWFHSCLNAAVPAFPASLIYCRILPGVAQYTRAPRLLLKRLANRRSRA